MKYSFIGLGNMASAIIAGMAASGKFKNDNIYGYNRSEGKTLCVTATGSFPVPRLSKPWKKRRSLCCA